MELNSRPPTNLISSEDPDFPTLDTIRSDPSTLIPGSENPFGTISTTVTTVAPSSIDTYAPIVEKYKRSKLIPWRKFIETPSFMSLVGELKETDDVCDLACGEGFYTRIMRQMTKGKVYGMDYCQNMINLAKY